MSHSEVTLRMLEVQDIGGYELLPELHLATLKKVENSREKMAVLQSTGVEYSLMNGIAPSRFSRPWKEGDVVKVMLPAEGWDLAFVYSLVEHAPPPPTCECCGQTL